MKKLMVAMLAMLLVISNTSSRAEEKKDADGFVQLFDGKTMEGWDGDPKFWSVQDGTLTGIAGKDKADQPGSNTFLIYKGGELGDFELRVMWKLEGHNSGIQYRSKQSAAKAGAPNQWVVKGYQADMDGTNQYTGICYEEGGRGILVNRGETLTIAEDGKKKVESKGDSKEIVAGIKKNDWNEYVIVCKGNHCTQSINGKVTADFVDGEVKKQSLKGILALQLHAGGQMKVQFKDIRLKKLD